MRSELWRVLLAFVLGVAVFCGAVFVVSHWILPAPAHQEIYVHIYHDKS
jgi:lipopolysaccharide export LptBFGC system permease protein LptF